MNKKKIFSLLIALLLGLGALSATPREWSVESVPNVQIADRTQLVSNPDGILPAAAVDSLNAMLLPLKESGKAEVAVVALGSIGDSNPTEFRNQLFNHWGLGNKQADNGLLILLVLDQGAIEIETGYGVEGLLPDAICKRVIENIMIPRFREEQFGEGMVAGVGALALLLDGADPAEVTGSSDDTLGIIIVALLFGILPIAILILLAYHHNRCPHCKKRSLRRSGRVLISRNAYQKIYNVTYICSHCGKLVHRKEAEATGMAMAGTMGGGRRSGGGFGGGFGGGMSGGGGASGRF